MAITTKLELRQSQSLVMTPQLQQAIKLLQLSNVELASFVEAELERNPLLERTDADAFGADPEPANDPPLPLKGEAEEAVTGETETESAEADDGDWLDLDSGDSPTGDLDVEPQEIFPDADSDAPDALKESGWNTLSSSARANVGDDPNLEAYVAAEKTLKDHLTDQLILAFADPARRLVGHHIIDMTDEAGYLTGDLAGLAELLGATPALIAETLQAMQGFDPCGVFARDLRECLMLQLKEKDRCDPAMAALIENLDLLARHDLAALKRVANVSDEDLLDMIGEVKRLNPKPGLRYGTAPAQVIVPDVIVRLLSDGSFHVELNGDTLPRVLINRTYHATVAGSASSPEEKSYLADCFQTANWLVRSLDQRARTILKVAQEIVRQQASFFVYGVRHLRPLNLKTVADAIAMHESTVSRATANKYMATNRGLFELKYFFTSAIAATTEGDAHSSESVRDRIRAMIEAEHACGVLSDDKIVEKLKGDGIDIARRTVAKYREALRIPSSVERRRLKALFSDARR
jgi:RNA polymerase sigma-54 factor